MEPPCFNNKKEFEDWVVLASETGVNDPVFSFCLDCTPAYKAEMLQYKRCINPDTQFISIIDEDGDEETICA